jgi:hypothetical protein
MILTEWTCGFCGLAKVQPDATHVEAAHRVIDEWPGRDTNPEHTADLLRRVAVVIAQTEHEAADWAAYYERAGEDD